ncbi:uncharacterized protein K452DRAFT_284938 [Aplosporella prunicola CBS 121167]|uniref:Uncharacterized protein n=1 Tax=Aplosporella prunicola CBS 121167 TaxID=1176127 RepID=A0A6A6BMY2_9PEZI|nr:uncharacterized protein K452DRAFT_284938 [Aplosporella prunicola CBS 121167]KAF2144614.1 hypothetical protein K452DRAFT_284938 [Aplosporella prunicola CBS 121167]
MLLPSCLRSKLVLACRHALSLFFSFFSTSIIIYLLHARASAAVNHHSSFQMLRADHPV